MCLCVYALKLIPVVNYHKFKIRVGKNIVPESDLSIPSSSFPALAQGPCGELADRHCLT